MLGQKDLTEKYYNLALRNSREVKDRRAEGRILSNTCLILDVQNQRDEVHTQLEQALSLCRDVSDKKGEGWVLHNLGRACLASGKLKEAEEHFHEAWEIRRRIGDSKGMGWTLFHIGALALKHHKYEDALTSLLSAQKIFEVMQGLDLSQIQTCINTVQELMSKDVYEELVQRTASSVTHILDTYAVDGSAMLL